jgi:D-erythronate 2-dehydrogenase
MQVLVTGGAGFLGAQLSRYLLAAPGIALAGGPRVPIEHLVVVDRVAPPPDLLADARVRSVVGDLAELMGPTGPVDILGGADLVFHLAAAVSGECERDLDLGIETNLLGSLAVLNAVRRSRRSPVFVFASSLAVYGAWPGSPLPPVIEDDTLPTPMNSYGTQKLAVEQLVSDYTRRDLLDGRSVRLMTVSVRPGKPNAAASGFLSGIIREPLAGQRAVCPVRPETRVAILSPRHTIEGLVRAAETSRETWGPPVAVNLPALEVSVSDMVDALARVSGPSTTQLIDWEPDPEVETLFESWPARFASTRARALGLRSDPDFDSVIRQYLDSITASAV